MKVLSLFDGMACGYEALQRAGILIDKYYASEIDKYAIQIATKNHPDIIEIGDVCDIHYTNGYLCTHKDLKSGGVTIMNYAVGDIDLLIGGSPCTQLSSLGNGKGLEGDQSKLFYDYVRILKQAKPKYFLLENVKMKKEWRDKMTSELFGIEPVLIDSALLTAQHRERLYRVGELQEDGTYKKIDISLPEDKGILLKDILLNNVDKKYYLTQEQVNKIRVWKSYQNPLDRVVSQDSKFPTLTARGAGEYHSGMIIVKANGDEVELPCATQLGNSKSRGNAYGQIKAYTLRACNPNGVIIGDKCIRRLTPLECELLQGVNPGYTAVEGISDTQRYKVLGNGWTIPVIAHIFKYIFK